MVGLANDLGFKVYMADLDSDEPGRPVSTTGEQQAIYIDRKLSLTSRRWLLAKTLSARFLQRTTPSNFNADNSETLATSLLLPEEGVRAIWEHVHDEEAVAAWFQAPVDLTRARVSELGLHLQ